MASSARSARAQAKDGQQPVDVDPGGAGVVVGEAEFDLLAGQGQPLDQAQPAVDARQAAAPVLDAPGDHLAGPGAALVDVLAEQHRVDVRAQRVDVVDQQMRSCGRCGQQVAQHAVAQQVGHLVPVADRVQALGRQVVGVVAALAHALRPADERGVQALLHLLRLLVEQLLRHLLPGKAQIARHGHQAQADRPPRREDAAARR